MKILYGIQSTGNGHITRSAKIVNRLVRAGCMVDIVLSGKNSKIQFPFPIKYNFDGLTFFYNGKGNIDYWKTYKNLKIKQLIKDIRLDLSNYNLIISDFEPITAWAAEFQNKISVGIGNQYSFLSENVPRPEDKDKFSEFILKWMAPVKHPIGLHFDTYDKFIKPPILRDSLNDFDIFNRGHYTVYLSNWDKTILFEHFKKTDCRFEVFTDVKRSYRQENCYFKPIDKKLFDESFKKSHGVITAAGFQTCSEAIYLGKELIAIPIDNQYEQLCNAESLKRLGVKVGNLNQIKNLIELPNNQSDLNWVDPTNEIVEEILQFGFK